MSDKIIHVARIKACGVARNLLFNFPAENRQSYEDCIKEVEAWCENNQENSEDAKEKALDFFQSMSEKIMALPAEPGNESKIRDIVNCIVHENNFLRTMQNKMQLLPYNSIHRGWLVD